MPAYEMTAAEEQQYGNNLNIWQALRLLQTYAPLVQYAQRFLGETDPYRKWLIVAEAVEWVASKTDAQADDQAVRLVADILRTKEGEALVRWCVAQAEAIR
jgi:hypothetical protein